MRDINSIYGKRVKSNKDLIGSLRFPNSDEVFVLPKGKPSGKIKSYITQKGMNYFVIQYSEDKELYLPDLPGVEVVSDNEKDDSSFLNTIRAKIFSTKYNIEKDAGNKAGYLKEGFKDAFTGVLSDAKNIVFAFAGLYLVISIIQILKK